MIDLSKLEDGVYSLGKVSRVEVIDHYDPLTMGRAYMHWEDDTFAEISLQDDGRTLKIFVSKKQKSKNKFGSLK